MRFHHLLVLLPMLCIGGCQPLDRQEEQPPTTGYDLVPLDSLPMEWGHLVAVTPHVTSSGVASWYQLWFSEPESGRITLVPVYRPGLSYDPSIVTVIERAPAEAEASAPRSAP